jgi:lipopolysaccharide/colanic/teichoic acid biosynthesis glycosyltransferase
MSFRRPRGTVAGAPAIPLWGRMLKRTVDIVVAGLGLLVALPALIVIAIAVRIDSPGPAVFVQTRVGLDGRRFRFFKFRTMVTDNDDSEHRAYVAAMMRGEAPVHDGIFKLTGDPRITRVGRFLRRYSLDELPQLFNVLLGNMTLVGPRPAVPAETDLYDEVSWERLRTKPGLTGLWQVSGRCELDFWQMVDLDVAYWRQWNPWLDIKILLRTPKAVLSARGAA